MAAELPFSCRCGAVRGVIRKATARQGDFVVCHCTDCQAFANRFDAGDRVFGEDAGTLLYQSRCARVRIDRGREELRCLHLTKEPTLRWYACCCDTPLFNSFKNGKVPYITTLVGNCETETRKRLLGEPIGHLFVDDDPTCTGPVRRMSEKALMRRFFVRMVKDFVSGERRWSALFDPETLEPIAAPTRPTKENTVNVG